MKIASIFKRLPMRIALVIAAVAAAVVLPLAANADSQVTLESSLGVANYTAGSTTYSPSTNASTDQVVKFQVFYHNHELPDSGKVAQNLNVKVAMPTQAGATQTVTSTVHGDNTNTVTSSATVNTGSANSTLDFIPGSVVWRHNTGTNDQPNWVNTTLNDNIVTQAGGSVIENEKPCFNFAATITFMARVHTPSYKITKEVRVKGTQNWSKSVTANPGDEIEWRMQFQNLGNTVLNKVDVVDNTPDHTTTEAGTVQVYDANSPNGYTYDNSAIQGKQVNIEIGDYGAGSNAWIYFNSKLDSADKLACGVNNLVNTAYATPQGSGSVSDTATVTVNKTCESQPSYSCDLLQASLVSDNTYKFEVKTSEQNATVVDYTYNFGDNSSVVKTDKNTAEHTYKPGTYSANVKVGFNVNGDYKQVSSEACATNITVGKPPVTPPTTPPVTTLPSTGAAGIISGTVGVSAISYGLYAWYESRKALKGVK
jgi:uncharacterized repeat protein (TIGR01451 family)